MGQHELADLCFLRHPAAEPGVQMPGTRTVFRERAVKNGEIGFRTEFDQIVAVERVSGIGYDMVLKFNPVADAMETRRMGDRGRSNASLAQTKTAVGDFPNRDAKWSGIETRERGQHGPHEVSGATRSYQGQRRSGASLIFAEYDGIEKKWDKVGEVVGVEMRK